MKKRRRVVRKKSAGAHRGKVQNRVAMVSISGVVCMLLVMLVFQGRILQAKYDANEVRKSELQKELELEEARTKEIEELQMYMESDEYTEKIAKEKIGLVKENEIIFKENR